MPNVRSGDIRVLPSTDGAEIFQTRAGRAEIWTGQAWQRLVALVQITDNPLKATVRINARDLEALPHPTGSVTVISSIAGWQGSAAVFQT